MNWKVVLAATSILALIVVLRWLVPADRGPGRVIAPPDTRFDYALSGFTARFYDAEGALDLIVAGPRLEHDSQRRVALISDPRFHFEPDGADWRGRSRLGILERDTELIILEQDVVLSHTRRDGELSITTNRLQHDRTQRTITGIEPVEISQPGTSLRAGGLIMWLGEERMELKDHVEGEYWIAGRVAADDR